MPKFPLPGVMGAGMWLLAAAWMPAQDSIGTFRAEALSEVETAIKEVRERRSELAKKYAAALDGLEKKLAAAGDLDPIVRLREERERVLMDGGTTAHDDASLVEFRQKYLGALEALDARALDARTQVAEKLAARIRQEEAALTKAGQVDAALALRNATDALLREIGGRPAGNVPVEEDPPAREVVAPGEVERVEVPDVDPPVVEKPFAIKGVWLENLTVPAVKHRLRERVVIGDRMKNSWPTIVLSPGGEFSGTDHGWFFVQGGNLVARKTKFRSIALGADHACRFYLIESDLVDCNLHKAGVWYGGEQYAKFYLEHCIVRRKLSSRSLDVIETGFRADRSVFENIDLPRMNFRDKQPADYARHKWLRFVNCRFVNCRIPHTFLLLTQDCVFESCTFTDSARHHGEAAVTKPVEVMMYVSDCKTRISKMPENVALIQQPVSAAPEGLVPTLAEVQAKIDR